MTLYEVKLNEEEYLQVEDFVLEVEYSNVWTDQLYKKNKDGKLLNFDSLTEIWEPSERRYNDVIGMSFKRPPITQDEVAKYGNLIFRKDLDLPNCLISVKSRMYLGKTYVEVMRNGETLYFGEEER